MDKPRSQLGFNFGDTEPDPELEAVPDREPAPEPEDAYEPLGPMVPEPEPVMEALPMEQSAPAETESRVEPNAEAGTPLEFDEPVAASSISFLPDVPPEETVLQSPDAGQGTPAGGEIARSEGVRINSSGNVYPSARGRKSLRQAALSADLINIPADEELYSKQYYSMREVSAMFRENQSLIRYWETEFDLLQPKKNKKGDRFFRPVDVRNLELIYDLLRRRKFTIEGARDYLKNHKKADQQFAMIQSLKQIRAFLLELRTGL